MKKSNAGFSLVEVLISIFILSILTYVLLANTNTIAKISGSRQRIVAQNIVSKKIEELRNTPFVSLAASTFTVSELNNANGTVTISDYQANPNIKEVTVKVNWKNNNKDDNYLIKTLISNSGLNEIN